MREIIFLSSLSILHIALMCCYVVSEGEDGNDELLWRVYGLYVGVLTVMCNCGVCMWGVVYYAFHMSRVPKRKCCFLCKELETKWVASAN